MCFATQRTKIMSLKSFILLSGLLLFTHVYTAKAETEPKPEVKSSPPLGRFAQWLNPRTSPFIPIPEIDTDPNGGTTIGLLPVFLLTDAQQQIRRIIAVDITYNST